VQADLPSRKACSWITLLKAVVGGNKLIAVFLSELDELLLETTMLLRKRGRTSLFWEMEM